MASSKKHTDVAAIRSEIAAIRAEIAAVQQAPLPLAEAEEAMGRLLDRAASLYDPAVSVFARDPEPQLDSCNRYAARCDFVSLRSGPAAMPARG